MSHQDWICLLKTTRKFEAQIIVGNLQHENIDAVLINKQDAYLNGYVEVHVPKSQAVAAQNIIDQSEKNIEHGA
jgi:hypothetical protein